MKQIIIADISCIRLGNSIFGHYGKVAQMYCNLFSEDANVCIAGGKIYAQNFKDCSRIDLKYDCELKSLESKIGKIKFKLYSILNGIKLFSESNNSVIICQPYSFISWMVSLLLTHKRRGNKIILIEYRNELDKKINKILFDMTKHKIDGILCPNSQVGKAFGLPYCVVTDYIYDQSSTPQNNEDIEYDFGVFGIMSKGKDIADVVDTFSNTRYKVLIAGYFGGKKGDFCSNQTDNITVIDKYLSAEEYEAALSRTRYIILPYSESYQNQSSGVVFDILFKGKPVLTKNFKTFQFVKEEGLGILYDKSLKEVDFERLMEKSFEDELRCNIYQFISENSKQKAKILEFLSE